MVKQDYIRLPMAGLELTTLRLEAQSATQLGHHVLHPHIYMYMYTPAIRRPSSTPHRTSATMDGLEMFHFRLWFHGSSTDEISLLTNLVEQYLPKNSTNH